MTYQALQPQRLFVPRGVQFHSESAAIVPGHVRLGNAERVVRIRQLEEQRQLHAGFGQPITTVADSLLLQIVYMAVPHHDLPFVHS